MDYLPEHIEDIVTRVRNGADYTYDRAKADVESMLEEIGILDSAWRASEERIFLDEQALVRTKHLLRRLRLTSPPDAEASGEERLAYERLLEAVDAAIAE